MNVYNDVVNYFAQDFCPSDTYNVFFFSHELSNILFIRKLYSLPRIVHIFFIAAIFQTDYFKQFSAINMPTELCFLIYIYNT